MHYNQWYLDVYFGTITARHTTGDFPTTVGVERKMIERQGKRVLGMCAAALLALCSFATAAVAGPVTFPLGGSPTKIGFSGSGGSLSYTFGSSLDINGNLSQVIRMPESNVFGITGADVSIMTGACDAGCSKANGNDMLQLGFSSGTITITGGIPSMGIPNGTVLLSGTLTDIGATLDGNATKVGTGAGGPDKGGLTASVLVTMINATLLQDFGFAADDTFGSGNKGKDAGTGITFLLSLGLTDFSNFLSGGTIDGQVLTSRITVDPEPAPEPTTLLLFGSSFLMGAWMMRRKFASRS